MIETGMTGKQEKKVLVKLYCDDYLQFSPVTYGFSIWNYSVYMYAHIPVWYIWLVIFKTRWQEPIKHLCSGVCNSVLRHDYKQTKNKNRKADDFRFCIFIWERRYAEIPTCHQLCSVFRQSSVLLSLEMLALWIDIGLGARVTESRQLKQICNRRGRHKRVPDKEERFSPPPRPSGLSSLNLSFPF